MEPPAHERTPMCDIEAARCHGPRCRSCLGSEPRQSQLHLFVAVVQVFVVLVGHSSPGQQSWPVPPHSWQVAIALSQTNGSPQTLPPLIAVQHGWPSPPQAVHVFPVPHVVNGAVHETPPAQQGSPSPPHAVPVVGTQAPAVHVPSPFPQAPAAATHVLVL
jgi:hypothetical protein